MIRLQPIENIKYKLCLPSQNVVARISHCGFSRMKSAKIHSPLFYIKVISIKIIYPPLFSIKATLPLLDSLFDFVSLVLLLYF